MASAFSHLLVGAAIGLLASRGLSTTAVLNTAASPHVPPSTPRPFAAPSEQRLTRWLPWLAAAAAAAPDADVLMHAFVSYSHSLGHRGAFHSLGFYALLSIPLASMRVFAGHQKRVATTLFCAMASHSLLDMLTNGGLGIALFWPLSDERYFLPWRPIPVSPLSVGAFFSERGLRILGHELPFALPCFVAVWLVTRRSDERTLASDSSPAANGDRRSDDTSDDRDDSDSAEDPDDAPAVLEITDSIDLHHFAPRDILSVVEAYLEAAWEKGFEEVRLIHGRGKGVQRARVQKLLSTHPLVESYRDAPHTRGGWGATIAWLSPHDTTAGRSDQNSAD